MQESQERAEYTLVARKPSFGLPTGCPICLPLFLYLKFSNFPFHSICLPCVCFLCFHFLLLCVDRSESLRKHQIPYIESGIYVAYNVENGGVIKSLKEDGIVDLDTDFSLLPEWISMKAMVSTWLADAIMDELWQRLGITKENTERREAEIYKRAKIAYGALSTTLGDHTFLFERPSSLDAYFLGHVLFTLQAFPESSMLRSALLEHGSKPKKQPKRERTEEEKTFRRRARYFLVTQVVAVLVFLSVMSSNDFSEVEVDDDEDEDEDEDKRLQL
ncbi:hypothetical protein POPTR_018G147625v4 [Populus trichocarpa]|uniref:Uncharacterized protein n=1 Tax=Populus trichocarpa TaxID=3694 RepID=A0ACC0RQH0_POPTR|nr:hypothetical protein POPTR_018G147625v4 [Populus trichocarpa]